MTPQPSCCSLAMTLSGLLDVEFPARVLEPYLEVGILARVFLKSVKECACPGAKLIHGGAVSSGSLDAKGNEDCVDLEFDPAPIHGGYSQIARWGTRSQATCPSLVRLAHGRSVGVCRRSRALIGRLALSEVR